MSLRGQCTVIKVLQNGFFWTTLFKDAADANAQTAYEGSIRVALEEVEAKKLPETAEEKKKNNNNKEKRAEGDEEAQPRKEEKEIKSSEKREHRQEEKRLKKKEEKRKRAESPKVDGKSTTTRVDEGVSTQQRESAQPEEESTQIRTVATGDGEDPDITPLMRRRKENTLQGSTIDLPILQSVVKEKERRRREEEEKQEKMLQAQQIIAEGDLRRKLHDEEVRHNNAISAEEERIRLEEEQHIL
ncbi:capping protein inhibiting regulator of actin dynamics-like [Benincasa hispida]|uniref:capping protein inhibiting regulator of actin dynamics-like n=1 Tax=Benincasa hispida TaxID=102211 RepID=UPI0019029AC6|nr:capping protein inhibiting regulator of actin dynamics-like [Benincasa hispida]